MKALLFGYSSYYLASNNKLNTMTHYPFQHSYNEMSWGHNTSYKVSVDMVKSMIDDGGNDQNYISQTKIARLSQFLPQNINPEEQVLQKCRVTATNPMILTSRKNRKYSESVFNRQLMQNVNRSKLFQSKIVEPLKFGDKDKGKGLKIRQQINKNEYQSSDMLKETQQSNTGSTNRSHLVFGSSKVEKSKLPSSKLCFASSTRKDCDKQEIVFKKSVSDLVNTHTKQIIVNAEEKNSNLSKYKSPLLVKAKTADYTYQKEKIFGSQLEDHREVYTPPVSSTPESNNHKKFQTFSTANMTVFFKKAVSNQKNDIDSPFRKIKQIEAKDGSSSDLTLAQSLRSSLNQLSRQDFYMGRKLGKGKFGQVFLVKHKEIGFLCAMKIIPKKVVLSEKIENQLCSEMKIQLYLCHPNIVSLYGIFSDKQNLYLLMEPCLDGQLYHFIKKRKRISERQTSLMIKQVCIAVDYIHGQKIIHRDIKPENILLSQGVIKICDFGWAVFHNDQFRDTFCGTPLYLSPELLNQNTYNDKVDNWAIGILTYEMLFGRIPFRITNKQELQKILFEEIVFPDFIETSQNVKNFIMMMLQRNPEKRAELFSCLCHPFLNLE